MQGFRSICTIVTHLWVFFIYFLNTFPPPLTGMFVYSTAFSFSLKVYDWKRPPRHITWSHEPITTRPWEASWARPSLLIPAELADLYLFISEKF